MAVTSPVVPTAGGQAGALASRLHTFPGCSLSSTRLPRRASYSRARSAILGCVSKARCWRSMSSSSTRSSPRRASPDFARRSTCRTSGRVPTRNPSSASPSISRIPRSRSWSGRSTISKTSARSSCTSATRRGTPSTTHISCTRQGSGSICSGPSTARTSTITNRCLSPASTCDTSPAGTRRSITTRISPRASRSGSLPIPTGSAATRAGPPCASSSTSTASRASSPIRRRARRWRWPHGSCRSRRWPAPSSSSTGSTSATTRRCSTTCPTPSWRTSSSARARTFGPHRHSSSSTARP